MLMRACLKVNVTPEEKNVSAITVSATSGTCLVLSVSMFKLALTLTK